MSGERIPPHSLEAEAVLLGSMFLESEIIPSAAELVKPGDFYRPGHGVLFDLLADMAARGLPVDLVTVKRELEKRNLIGPATGGQGYCYVTELVDGTPSAANWRYYAGEVLDLSKRRQAISIGLALAHDGYGSDVEKADELIGRYQQRLYGLAGKEQSDHSASIAQAVDDVLAYAEAISADRTADTSLASGLPALDSALGGGFSPGDLVTLAADTGAGKSTLAANIAANVARRGGRVLFVSAEMMPRETGRRFLAAASGVYALKLKQGWTMEQQDWREAEQAAAGLAGWKLHLHCRACTVGEIALQARRLGSQWKGLDLVCVDYLQLMKPTEGDSRAQQVGAIAWGLKQLAMDLGCVVLMLSQLNRATNATGQPPGLHGLKESGDVENHSNAVLLLHRPANGATRGDELETWLRIAKNRDGVTTPWEGLGAIRLAWRPGITRFDEKEEINVEYS